MTPLDQLWAIARSRGPLDEPARLDAMHALASLPLADDERAELREIASRTMIDGPTSKAGRVRLAVLLIGVLA